MNDVLQLEDAQAEALMGQIVDEFLERKDRGERPDVDEFARRYPELAVVIRQMLPAMALMQWSADESTVQAPAFSEEITPEGPLGDYRLVREIGRGGMGVVYEAMQISLGRRVALKVLPFAAALDAKQRQRFLHEAQAAAQLHHQNIVPVYGVGCERGVHYYAMQFIDGQTLAAMIADLMRLAGPPALDATRNADSCAGSLAADMLSGAWLANLRSPHAPREENGGQSTPAAAGQSPINGKDVLQQPLPDTVQQVQAAVSTENSTRSPAFFRTSAQLGIQAAEALEHSHGLGVVHRDIKPTNLLIDARGRLWITDFGLAHIHSDTKLTMTGDILGTLRYMSPEQALAQRVLVDHRTDIYSLGATLYELLTLEPVFSGADRRELLRQIAFEEPRRPRQVNKAIPVELETIVLKALEKNPTERYGTAQELADDLARFLKDEPIRAKRPSLVQRTRKWARRHRPVVASAIVATMAVVAVAIIALLISLGNISAAFQRERQVNDELALTSYCYSIALAERQLSLGNVGGAEELLNQCPPKLRDWEWHFLKRQRYGPPRFLPHSDTVVRVAFSRDGRQIASVCMDGTVQVRDARTGAQLHTLQGQTPTVSGDGLARGMVYSPNGRYLALARFGGTVLVWDAATGQLLHTLKAHQGACLQVAFSPDSQTLASAGADRFVVLWEVASGEKLQEFSDHPAAVKGVAFRPDGRSVLAACEDGTVKAWDRDTREERFLFRAELRYPSTAFFSPDAKRLAWASKDGAIKIWNTITGELEMDKQTNLHECRAVAFHPDGKRIALAGFNGTLRLLDAATGREMLTIFAHTTMVADAVFSHDGKKLASASYDHTVRIWDATPLDGDPQSAYCVTLTGHEQRVTGVAISRNGRWLASSSWDGTVKLWEHSRHAPRDEPGAHQPERDGYTFRHTLRGHSGNVSDVAFSPDNQILASSSRDKTVKLWDLRAPRDLLAPVGDSLPEVRTIRCAEPVSSIAFSPNGQRLAVGQAKRIALYDVATGNEVPPFKATPAAVPSLAFSPENRWLVSAGASDPAVTVWDVAGEKYSFKIPNYSGPNAFVAVSPDGRRIAAPGRDQAAGDATVEVWDVDWDTKKYTEFRRLKGHRNYVWKVAFSPDGRYLASGSWDSTIKVWDLEAPASAEPVTLHGHAGFIYGLAFSPDGKRLATGSGSARHGELKVWDKSLWENASGDQRRDVP